MTPHLRALGAKLLVLAVVALMLAIAPPAFAQGDAAALFDQARELFDAKRFEEALPKFEETVAATKSPNARLYLGRCLRELGRFDAAHRELQQTVRDAGARAAEDAYYAQTRDTAARELAALDANVGKLVINLSGDSPATVRIAGRELATGELGVPVAVLPGDAIVEVDVAGSDTIRRVVQVDSGATRSVAIALPAAAPGPLPPSEPGSPAPAEPAPETSPESDDGPAFSVVQGVGVGVAAVGVAGMVLFGVMTATADDKLATLETQCGGTRCTDPALAEVVDDGKQAETISFVGLGFGIAGLTAGAAMLIFGGSDDEANSAFTPLVLVSPRAGIVGGRVAF